MIFFFYFLSELFEDDYDLSLLELLLILSFFKGGAFGFGVLIGVLFELDFIEFNSDVSDSLFLIFDDYSESIYGVDFDDLD